MRFIIALCISIICAYTVVSAQELTAIEIRINHLNDSSSDNYDIGKFEAAKLFVDSAMFLATQQDYKYGIADASQNLAILYYYGLESNNDSLLFYIQKCYDISVENHFEYFTLNTLSNLSLLYNRSGEYTKALDLAFELAERASNSEIDSLKNNFSYEAYSNIGDAYISLENYPKALEYVEKSSENAPKGQLDAITVTKAYVNILLENYQLAYEQAFEALESMRNDDIISYDTIASLYVAGRAAYHLGQVNEAKDLLNKSLEGSLVIGEGYYIVFNLNTLAEISYDERKYNQTLSQYIDAVKNAEIGGFRAEKVKAFLGLYKTYLALNKSDRSLEYYLKYTALKDSIFNEKISYQLYELDTKYKTTQKQQEIEQKNEQLKQQEIQRNALIAGLGMLVIVVIVIYRSQRQKAKINKELAEKNKQIKEVENLKGRWFANVAHELKTPLTLIDGPLSKVLEKEQISQVVTHDLTLVKKNVRRLSALIFEILEVSKIEENQLKLKIAHSNISTIVRQVVSSFHSTAQVEDIKLVTEIEKDFIMDIDEAKTFKVLINLVSNAFKFTPSGGNILVRISQGKKHITVSVKDSGSGISKEDQQYIFDRFFQSNDPTKSRQGGTGIGLSIAKEIAQLHGGSISVKSELEQGSEFNFKIPLERLVEASLYKEKEQENIISPEKPQQIELDVSDKPKLLLVEDNADMRSYICSFMKYDFSIVEAKDGIEALDLLSQTSPDLIISDLMMPRMDGIELAKKVKANKEWQNIPFITLTAMASEAYKLEALRIGVDDYLAKPFSQDEIMTRSKNLLENAKQRKESSTEEEVIGFDDKLIKKLYTEVSKNLSSPLLKVSYLADIASMSERQLQRYLKKQTGLSPNQFIREIKLQKALELLEKKVYPTIAEVRSAVGFERASHFTELFENRFGKKPKDYQ